MTAERWALERRLDYIDWLLWRRGTLGRDDLARQFSISRNQATQDIGLFEAAYPGALRYDPRRRTYVAAEGYTSRRGLDDPRIILAMRLLHDAGHPLGWPDPRLEAADAALAILAAAGTSRDDLTTEDWRRIVAGCFG